MGQLLYLYMNKFNSLIQLFDYFKDEETCETYLGTKRWGNTPCCPQCGSTKAYVTNRGFKCADKDCYKKFTVKTKTIYENTKIGLRTWFGALYLITAHKKGISSLQLARHLNVSQKTAWFMLHRIREMLRDIDPTLMNGVVEADETYVGGKNKNRHANKKVEGSQGRAAKDKTPVVGMVERNCKVKTFVVKNTDAETIQNIVRSNIAENVTLITDAYRSYSGLNAVCDHITIKHTEGNYKTVGDKHTNTIEGFWSLFKRQYVGANHYMAPQHLQRYMDEMSYRYNNRKVSDCVRFEQAILRSETQRIKYVDLTAYGRRKEEETNEN